MVPIPPPQAVTALLAALLPQMVAAVTDAAPRHRIDQVDGPVADCSGLCSTALAIRHRVVAVMVPIGGAAPVNAWAGGAAASGGTGTHDPSPNGSAPLDRHPS